jgi:hypothetical protein
MEFGTQIRRLRAAKTAWQDADARRTAKREDLHETIVDAHLAGMSQGAIGRALGDGWPKQRVNREIRDVKA